MRIFIVHGYQGTPQSHWFPWLSRQLTDQGHQVSTVVLPSPSSPQPQQWIQALATAVGDVDKNTVIVTHSLGGITTLRYLNSLPRPWSLRGLIMVAGFLGKLSTLPELDYYLSDSLPEYSLQIEKWCQYIDTKTMIYSNDDPVVPPSQSLELAKLLQAKTIQVEGGAHFCGEEGWLELPQVKAEIESLSEA